MICFISGNPTREEHHAFGRVITKDINLETEPLFRLPISRYWHDCIEGNNGVEKKREAEYRAYDELISREGFWEKYELVPDEYKIWFKNIHHYHNILNEGLDIEELPWS